MGKAGEQERKPSHESTLQASGPAMSINIPLGQGCHVAKPKIK